MEKIISLFQRNYDGDRLVRDEVVPGAAWVLAGEGVATRKFDGTCCMVKDGKLFKRYDAKEGKTPPDGFIPAQEPDVTKHWPGWLPVGEGPEDRWHREALEKAVCLWSDKDSSHFFADGATYELCGPKVNGDPERLNAHYLIAHGKAELPDCPRDFAGIRAYLAEAGIEGIVWWHPDGKMCKIKAKDFFKGYKR